jgi:hypothetical protein
MLKKSLFFFVFIILTTIAYSETCDRGWICEGAYRTYRNSGCEILVREQCVYGCKIDGCVEIKTCTPGFVCNGNFKQYMDESCTVSSNLYCQYGCLNGTCKLLPEKTLEIENKKNESAIENSSILLAKTPIIGENLSQNITQVIEPVKKVTLLEKISIFVKGIIEKISNAFS